MKRNLVIFILFLLIGASLGFKTAHQPSLEETVAADIKMVHLNNLNAFLLSCQDLATKEQLGFHENDLKSTFLNCRAHFKSCEFLLMYTDNPISRQFNGPNLITSKFNINQANNLEDPHGLQVIEDLIYKPDQGSKATLKKELSLLIQLTQKELEHFEKQKLTDPSKFNIFVLDAMRFELIRIESLGITGFDVPNSENAIPEASSGLESLLNSYKHYLPILKKKGGNKLAKQTIRAFTKAIKFCKASTDFDTFDRLTFIDQYIHPLSVLLKTSAQTMDYEFFHNLDAINRTADHLFSRDALNPLFFTPIYSEASVELGKKLFNEPLLSVDKSRSCATCHQSEKAFTDGLVKNTTIIGNEPLLRNTPSLLNVAYQTKFFYDSRDHTLEGQSLSVIHNKLEMGVDLKNVLNTLKAIPAYQELFARAFAKEVDENLLSQALADYLETLVSLDSKLDLYLRGEPESLNESEKRGFNLFTGKAKCATCHFLPLFNGLLPPFYNESESEILGVPASKLSPNLIDPDLGKFGMSKLEIHQYAFKTPSLKEVAKTSPYMHNGVFDSLEEVVEFYNNGGGAGQGMPLSNQTLSADSLHLTELEIQDLVHFMQALGASD